VVFGSGKSRSAPEGTSPEAARGELLELLKELGPIAENQKLTVAVEPLSEGNCNVLNRVRDGAELVREVNHPRIRLMADIYHMQVNGEEPGELEGVVDLLAHVHVADVIDRRPPSDKGTDLKPYFAGIVGRGHGGRRCSLP